MPKMKTHWSIDHPNGVENQVTQRYCRRQHLHGVEEYWSNSYASMWTQNFRSNGPGLFVLEVHEQRATVFFEVPTPASRVNQHSICRNISCLKFTVAEDISQENTPFQPEKCVTFCFFPRHKYAPSPGGKHTSTPRPSANKERYQGQQDCWQPLTPWTFGPRLVGCFFFLLPDAWDLHDIPRNKSHSYDSYDFQGKIRGYIRLKWLGFPAIVMLVFRQMFIPENNHISPSSRPFWTWFSLGGISTLRICCTCHIHVAITSIGQPDFIYRPRCTDSAAAVEANALSALEQIQVSGLKIGSVPRWLKN